MAQSHIMWGSDSQKRPQIQLNWFPSPENHENGSELNPKPSKPKMEGALPIFKFGGKLIRDRGEDIIAHEESAIDGGEWHAGSRLTKA